MSCMPHRWYYVYTKITPTPITVYHSNYRKQIFFSLFCNEVQLRNHIYVYVLISNIYIHTYMHTRYKYIEIIYKYIDIYVKWLWLFQLWCSSSFGPFFWSGCKGSANNSLKIRRREAVLRKRQCSEEEAVKMQRWLDKKRVLSPNRSPAGKLWQTQIL